MYTRETQRQKLLVICSFTDKPVRFRPPRGCDLNRMQLLLTNYDGSLEGSGFVTRPYETRVYLHET